MAYVGKSIVNEVFASGAINENTKTLNIIGNDFSKISYIPGFYYSTVDIGSSGGSASSSTNDIILNPITIRDDISISEITLLNISNASAGKLARFGLYYNRGFFPAGLYKDFGTALIDTSPVILSVSETIKKGRYFFAIFFEAGITCSTNGFSEYLPETKNGFKYTGYTFSSGFPNLTNVSGTSLLYQIACGFKVS